MIFRQRDEGSNKSQSIQGRKINNYIACNVKETKTLNPHINQMFGPEETFETDSFKQILTKRSAKPHNKENISGNGCKLKKIKEETNRRQKKQKTPSNNDISKPNPSKRKNPKNSTTSLHKIFKYEKSADEKAKRNRKSYSPQRELKNYRSGPDNKNYISNYISKNNRELTNQRSEKALTERVKHNQKSLEITQREGKGKCGKSKKEEEGKKVIKRRKNVSKVNLFEKKHGCGSVGKLQELAKEFDGMVKKQKKKKVKKKQLSKTSREKKVVMSINNSNTHWQKMKKPLEQFSEDSFDNSKHVLERKYSKNKVEKKNQRMSFDHTKRKKKQKDNHKIKTQCLSPTKDIHLFQLKSEAATKIQKVFRGYITRKYLDQFKTVMKAVINIQRIWRGYQGRKKAKKVRMSLTSQNSLSGKLVIESPQKIHELLHSSIQKAETGEVQQLTNLLEQILYEEKINEKIKQKIVNILNKQVEKSSARSSIKNHSEAEIESQRLFFKDMKEKKNKQNSPPFFGSPKLEKSHLLQSPEIMVENLLTIQQFHKEKLVSAANIQKEGINQLAMKKIFSPRTQQAKTKEIEEKLKVEIQKFDSNMDQILKSCRGHEYREEKIKPFSGISTPEHERMIEEEGINSSEKKIQDLSMELIDYYDEKKVSKKFDEHYESFDSGYFFIEDYLLNLFEFIRETREDFKQEFISIMKKDKNLGVGIILKNLIVVTEDSEEDITFKLPMYKYLQNNSIQIITKDISESFNENFEKLQRNQLRKSYSLEDIYIKMLIDCLNQAFHCLRPSSYIFTETALRSRRMKAGLQNIILLNQEHTELDSQFSYYFALAMELIFKWGNLNCGMLNGEEIEQGALLMLNENKTKQFMKMEAEEEWIFYDELIEILVSLSDAILDEIMMEEGALLYY